jgi:Protein of unknown function (DUF2786)
VVAGRPAVRIDWEALDVGKASRQRRQQKEKERQRRRGAPDGTAPGAAFGFGPDAGPRRVPADGERASIVIAEALTAVCDGHQDAYAKALTELASERTPAWTRAVSRGLVELLRMSVKRAWRAGWQPAELTRHAGRELSQEHVSVAADMIIGEMREYAAVTVDQRWAAQVAAVRPLSVAATAGGAGGSPAADNGSWWGNEADYLGAWQQRSGTVGGLRDAIATAIELFHLFQHLPVLEQLLPLPGAARVATAERAASPGPAGPAGPAGSGGQADERMLSRIRALLAKAEATEYAEEAEALSARAQELMAKYSIDQALLAAESGRKDAPAGRRIAVDNPYEAPKTSLLQAVATANRCRVVWSKEVGLATVVGFEADLDAVELLFTSLLVQASAAMLHAGSRQDAYGRSRTRAFRQSFLVSYAIRIGERLSQAAEHATREAAADQDAAAAGQPAGAVAGAGGTALVPFLAARQEAVDDAVDEMFGDSLRRGRSVRATDAEGWASGRAAADLASLHNHAPVRQ